MMHIKISRCLADEFDSYMSCFGQCDVCVGRCSEVDDWLDWKRAHRPPVLYYYTDVPELNESIVGGRIACAVLVEDVGASPVVWMSERGDWDVVGGRYGSNSREGLLGESKEKEIADGYGLLRIVLYPDAAVEHYFEYRDRGEISRLYSYAFALGAKWAQSSAWNFWASDGPVPVSKWVGVEEWDDDAGTWVEYPVAIPKK